MDKDPLEYSESLDLMGAYRAGRLSPVQAHRIARLLEEDPIFRREAERDAMIEQAIASLELELLPRGLVERSVLVATGGEASAGWFSLDSVLIALGVGVAAAGGAHFVTSRMDVFGRFGDWFSSLAAMILGGELDTLLGITLLVTLGALGLVGFGAWRLLRTE